MPPAAACFSFSSTYLPTPSPLPCQLPPRPSGLPRFQRQWRGGSGYIDIHSLCCYWSCPAARDCGEMAVDRYTSLHSLLLPRRAVLPTDQSVVAAVARVVDTSDVHSLLSLMTSGPTSFSVL